MNRTPAIAVNIIKTLSVKKDFLPGIFVAIHTFGRDMKRNIEYLGKYLKRPPIGETRIKNYDGKFVTYHFLDHYTNTTQYLKLPVLDFIARLISYVPDKHFRNIRYYGFLSNLPDYVIQTGKNFIKTSSCCLQIT